MREVHVTPKRLNITMAFLIAAGSGASLLCPEILSPEEESSSFILLYLRLPRTLIALVSGAALGLSGAVLQSYFRNPLSDPSLLGISSLSALGAVIAIYTGLYHTWFLALPILSMGGALLAPLLFYLLFRSGEQSKTLILTGIGLSSFISAVMSLFLNVMDNNFALLDIIFWMFGSFADHTYQEMGVTLPFALVGIAILARLGRRLDMLSFGEDMAHTLGLSLRKLTHLMIMGVSLAIGGTVALTGVVGFIGLIVPHMMRFWVKERPRDLLVPSCLGGAFLALVSDIAVRLLPTHGELKVGVVTSLLGAPFFIYLLMRTKHADVS